MPANIVLPVDPEWQEPIIMGNAYDGKTPKTSQEKFIKELEAEHGSEQGTFKYAHSTVAVHPDPWMKTAQVAGVSNMMTQPMWFSPLHTPQSWQVASKRREIMQWNRFWLDNEPKVAAALRFYSFFPINGFVLECKSQKILDYFDYNVVKRLELHERCKEISSEYYTIGDVFIHKNVECPVCNGKGIDPETGEVCNHPGGTFNRLVILNPDWIEVQQTPLAGEPSIVMIPDEELKNIVFYRSPKSIYDRIPRSIKELVMAGKPIPLSNRTTCHLKHMAVPYGTYGTSLTRCLFTTLAYKTKIMTANWIVAERLILPVRVVKVGSDQRPASSADIADIQQQLAATANDPNLTIVTHHNFEYDWFGACFDINTEILTTYGWKTFKELSSDDVVATYNKQNGMMEFQTIQKKHEYDFASNDKLKMIHFNQRGVDVMVTPEHRMLVERKGHLQTIMSQEIKHKDKFISSMQWEGFVPTNSPYQDSPFLLICRNPKLTFS